MTAAGFATRSVEIDVAHIGLGLDETENPGITGLFRYRPETAALLGAVAEVLLRAPHPTLTPRRRSPAGG